MLNFFKNWQFFKKDYINHYKDCFMRYIKTTNRVWKRSFASHLSIILYSDEKVFLPYDILLENSLKIHLSAGNEGRAISLPDAVRKSLLSQSCDSKEIVDQFSESLELSEASLERPDDETKNSIRCLAREANLLSRLDVVKCLRNISPAGTTGESITFVMHK